MLIEALTALTHRGDKVTKESLRDELRGRGIVGLSTNTTDHTTFKNWLVHAELVDDEGKPVDESIKKILGISATELDEFKSLSLGQQVFLQTLRQ